VVGSSLLETGISMKTHHNGLLRTSIVVILALTITAGLGEFYSLMVQVSKLPPWKAAVVVHLFISSVLYLLSSAVRETLRLKGVKLRSWLPAVGILVGSFILAISGERAGPSYAVSGSSELMYVVSTLTIIPFFEEIVFRAGITPILSRFTSSVWSIWLSAMVFSVAHTQPTFERLMGLQAGFLFGPFILGICCDMIVRRWGKLWPAIAFHSACNATVYIFSTWNPAWLSRLGGFYM
jgi:membrane protease YdiL (CAAX protease family)